MPCLRTRRSNAAGRRPAEMLDFCGQKNITSDIELIDIKEVNAAMSRLEKGDVKYRFVLDIANTLK